MDSKSKICVNCKYFDSDTGNEPCHSCYPLIEECYWEPKEDKKVRKVKVVFKSMLPCGVNEQLHLECVDWDVSTETKGVKPMIGVYFDEKKERMAMIPLENVLYVMDMEKEEEDEA